NPLPRPRDYRSSDFAELVDRLYEIITGHELPDAPAPAGVPAPVVEALPRAQPSAIIGLLEYLQRHGGREDVFRIAHDTGTPFAEMIEVVEAAELLYFVDTPRRLVVLQAEGRRLLDAGPAERPRLWREQLLKLCLFRDVYDALQ